MGDYVKRSDVHKVFQPKYAPAINRTFAAMIDSVPAADVVEVVRCRECVHCCGVSGEPPFEEAYEAYCGEHDWCVSETYFCADGERKDGGQDE